MELFNIDGKLIFKDESQTTKETTINALKNKADLSEADLSRANLSGAYLSGADLSRAYLSGADLSRAYLSIFSKWNISYSIDEYGCINVRIGCKEKTIKYWDFFFSDKDNTEFETERNSKEWNTIKNHYLAIRLFLQLEGKIKDDTK